MPAQPTSAPAATGTAPPAPHVLLRLLHGSEDAAVALVLGALVVLPLSSIAQRELSRFGIPGAAQWLTQLTFVLAMLGAALAARHKRLLSLSALEFALQGPRGSLLRGLGNLLGSGVSAILAATAWRYVQTERESGAALPLGVPQWIVSALLPLTMAILALRLWWQCAPAWQARAIGLLALTAALAWVHGWTRETTPPVAILAGLLVAGTLLGMPLFAAIAGATAVCLWHAEYPLASIPLKIQALTTSSSLPTIPLFTLAGYLLARGSSSQRLVDVFRALAGEVRSGPALVTILVCTFFTTFTGASGVTILALGGLLMPMLRASGYAERASLGLITGSSALGMLFPPCLPLILYAIVANTALANADVFSLERSGVTIEHMFLAGLLPGALLVACAWSWGRSVSPSREARREPLVGDAAYASSPHPPIGRSLWKAKWELLLPLAALVAIFSGLATPLESAALAASWAFLVATLRRDLKLGQLVALFAECGALVGGILAILGASMGLTHFLVLEQIPLRAAEWASASIESRLLFLLALNGFLLVVGCLLDIFSAVVVVVPLIVPMGQQFGIDPLHLGVIFLANLELGYLTPPVGLNLFLAAGRFQVPFVEVARAVLPLLCVLAGGVLVITYVPWLSTWLPKLLLD